MSDINFLLFTPTEKCTEMFLPKVASASDRIKRSHSFPACPSGALWCVTLERSEEGLLRGLLRDKIAQTVAISVQHRGSCAIQNLRTTLLANKSREYGWTEIRQQLGFISTVKKLCSMVEH